MNNIKKDNTPTAKEVVIEVMRHFGYRRNYQVAEFFNVTPQTLSGWLKVGEIPPKHMIKYNSEILNYNDLNIDIDKSFHPKVYNLENYNGKYDNQPVEDLFKILRRNVKKIILIPSFF